MQLHIKNNFVKSLPGDPITENYIRQVEAAAYSKVAPSGVEKPRMIHVSPESLKLLGISEEDAKSEAFLDVFSGKKIPTDSIPFAMNYGGHQFGNWAGQLGDGRAINLGEIENDGKTWALQLKGAGKTPYSRQADGQAVLRSSIREHLAAEAMYHLGVPTTRSLSLALTGNDVLRDIMYDGHPEYEKGAVVCRMAESFVRFGNFQIFASRSDFETLKTLADYVIENFYPEITEQSSQRYVLFFEAVAKRTLDTVIHWQRVGFVHGVLNTDNMSILGLTIDFGPYGWLDVYDKDWTPNTTDRQNRRYRYQNQPAIAHWNLLQLANALYALVNEAEGFEKVLNDFAENFQPSYLAMMKSKIGLELEVDNDKELVAEMENLMQQSKVDMTIFYRLLATIEKGEEHSEEKDWIKKLAPAFYNWDSMTDEVVTLWANWMKWYQERLQQEELSDDERKLKMNAVNPKYILRNYMAVMAIEEADKGNYDLLNELFEMLKQPYAEQPENEKWFALRPDWAENKVGCSMLSCSS